MTFDQIKQSLIQRAADYQNFVESNKSYAPLPNLKQGKTTAQKVARFVPQMGIDIANTVVGKGILNPVSDTTRQIIDALKGRQTDYSTLKSSASKLGRNLTGDNASATEIIGNTAGTINPILSAYTGPKTLGAANSSSLVQALKTGAKSGAIMGGTYGALSGLEGTRSSLVDQLRAGLTQGAQGAVVGGVLGGVTAGIGYEWNKQGRPMGMSTKAVDKSDDYLYHGTNEDVLENISKEGLKPGRRGQLSLSKDEAYARSYAHDGITPNGKTNAVTFRVKKSVLEGKTTVKRADGKSRPLPDQLHELLTTKTIPPEQLEVYRGGKWQQLIKDNPLLSEAKKYKSIEEYKIHLKEEVSKKFGIENPSDKSVEDWFIAKQKGIIGGPQKDLVDATLRGETTGWKTADNASKELLDNHFGNNVGEKVVVYRGINPSETTIKSRELYQGDFVTGKKEYASQYGKVQKFMVDKKDLIFAPDGKEILVANGKNPSQTPINFSQLTSIWNKANQTGK